MSDEISGSLHRVERELGQVSPPVRGLHGDEVCRNRSRRDASIIEKDHAGPVRDRLDVHDHRGTVGAHVDQTDQVRDSLRAVDPTESGHLVGKDELDPLAALARILAIRHHTVALIGPGMLGVIAHDAAEVKSQGLERRGAREFGR